MKTFETYLPIFTGFYGTIFEASGEDCEIEDINSQREDKRLSPISWEDCNFNYKEYHDSVSRECVNFIEGELEDLLGKGEVRLIFQKLISPREYNFANDSINIEVELSKTARIKIVEVLFEYNSDFEDYLKNRYTSCDGFISRYSNKAEEWMEDVMKWDEDLMTHRLGTVFDFLLREVNQMDEEYLYNMIETHVVFVENYDELLTKIKED